jgi:hypothetical protein
MGLRFISGGIMRDYDDNDYYGSQDDWQRPRYPLRTIIFALILLIAMLIGVLYPVASLFFQGGGGGRPQPPRQNAPLIDAMADAPTSVASEHDFFLPVQAPAILKKAALYHLEFQRERDEPPQQAAASVWATVHMWTLTQPQEARRHLL